MIYATNCSKMFVFHYAGFGIFGRHKILCVKPYTAPGFDDASLYLFSVVPHNMQTFICNACLTLINSNIPFHWRKAKIFLLY